jgi:Ca2+-binding EF-hand superfamily protein
VCLAELVAGLSDAGYALAPGEVEKLMARLDVDGDGSVDRAELLAALLDWRQLQADAAWAGWVQRAFDRLDADRSGCIDLAELAWVAKSAGGATGNAALAEAAALLREADADGDGRISRAEFDAVLCEATADDALALYDARLAAAAVALRPLDEAREGGAAPAA